MIDYFRAESIEDNLATEVAMANELEDLLADLGAITVEVDDEDEEWLKTETGKIEESASRT